MSSEQLLNAKSNLTPYQSLLWLWSAFLHGAVWGTKDYESLNLHERAEFSNMVSAGDLHGIVEDLKLVCLLHGVKVPDAVLAETGLVGLKGPDALPPATRQRLASMYELIAPVLCRLQADDVASTDLLTSEPQRARALNINGRMFDLFTRHPDSTDWTCREWTTRLDCSESAIIKQKAWRMVMLSRANRAADRTSKRHARAPKK